MGLVSARDRARCAGATGRPGRRAAGVTAAAAGLVLVAGCHAPWTSSSAAGPTGSGTVTVAAAPGVADAPLYIAIKNGLFRQAGLNVKVVPSATVSSGVNALHSGQADIAFGDYADMFYAQQRQPSLGLSIVANGYDAAPGMMEVLTLPHSGITKPSKLIGRVIGTPPAQEMPASQAKPYSLETVATWSVLSSDSVQGTKVHWQPMPTSSLVKALGTHQVPAILATEPTIFQAESTLGAVPVLDAATGATANLPVAGYFTDASYAKRNATNLAAFRAALLKAQSDASSTSTSVQSALMKYDKLNGETASLITLGTYPTTLQEPDLQQVATLMFLFNAQPAGQSTLSVPSLIHP
jgi:NitT/TauT family transport system substrate-binding protein